MKHLIIGGGLAGLYTAYLLQKQGETDYLLLEAADHFGGRASGLKISEDHQLELGATWFWQDFQPDLARLIHELGLQTFDQPMGKLVYEISPYEIPKVMNYPYVDGQRVVGGMSKLIDALALHLDKEKLYLNSPVQSIVMQDNAITVKTAKSEFIADKIWLAVPPRVAVERMTFIPALPQSLQEQWQNTDTWMAPHAKFIAHFNRPFWRDEGLSGNARSRSGPMVEVHDISNKQGTFGALFGFIGVPAQNRVQISPENLTALCEAQLMRLFGEQAKTELKQVYLKDWAQDPLIATPKDISAFGEHPHTPSATAKEGDWQNRLIGVTSEFSPNFAGYLAGAVEAAELGVAKL